MKILILLALVAIGLAKHNNGRSAFVFPGQPSPDSGPHKLVWDTLVDLVPVEPERSRRQENKVSSEEQFELRNPNRRDVQIGNFLARGYHGAPENPKQDDDVKEIPEISLSVKSKSPLIKQEPSFTENTIEVLEKKSFSSEEDSESIVSSSQGQSSESVETNNQQESSSSEEKTAADEKKEESSSSEEVNALSTDQEGATSDGQNSESAAPNNEQEAVTTAKQEQSSQSEETSPPPVDQAVTSVNNEKSVPLSNKAEAPSSDSKKEETQSSVHNKVDKQKLPEPKDFQPFVAANVPSLSDRGLRKLSFSLRDVDSLRPPRKHRSRKGNAPGSRLVRGIPNFPDFVLESGNSNIIGPQVQVSNTQRRWKRPTKK